MHRVIVASALCWGAAELGLRVRLMIRPGLPERLRDWRREARHRIREWTLALTIAGGACAVIAAVLATRLRWARIGGGWIPFAIGEIVVVAGVALRIWAILTLDRLFTFAVGIADDHRVMREGPYRLVRHPGYAGALLALAGIGIALANWVSVLILLAVPVAVLTVRIGVEEEALTAALGEEYRCYARQTARLVPRVW
jgi:protein-S-isoprenylcysteine O-methyltransferase Ste14